MLITFLIQAWKLGWTRLSCATISYAASHFLCVSHSALPSNSALRWLYTLAKKTAARLMTPFHPRSLLYGLRKRSGSQRFSRPPSSWCMFQPGDRQSALWRGRQKQDFAPLQTFVLAWSEFRSKGQITGDTHDLLDTGAEPVRRGELSGSTGVTLRCAAVNSVKFKKRKLTFPSISAHPGV